MPDALFQNNSGAAFSSPFPSHLKASHFAAILPLREKKIQKSAHFLRP